jgi:hypothetical protein
MALDLDPFVTGRLRRLIDVLPEVGGPIPPEVAEVAGEILSLPGWPLQKLYTWIAAKQRGHRRKARAVPRKNLPAGWIKRRDALEAGLRALSRLCNAGRRRSAPVEQRARLEARDHDAVIALTDAINSINEHPAKGPKGDALLTDRGSNDARPAAAQVDAVLARLEWDGDEFKPSNWPEFAKRQIRPANLRRAKSDGEVEGKQGAYRNSPGLFRLRTVVSRFYPNFMT